MCCICDDNLGALIIEGSVPPVIELRKQLAEATNNIEDPQAVLLIQTALVSATAQLHAIIGETWDELFYDYLDASRDTNARYKFSVEIEVKLLESKLQRIESLLFVLSMIHVQAAVDELYKIDPEYEEFSLDPSNKDQYFEELNAIRDRSRELRIDWEIKQMELDELNESDKKIVVKRADRISFTNILANVATYKHVAVIHKNEITVSEFVAMLNEYLDHIKALSAPQKRYS